jgi:GNAT superfamily N-acetyltransferase
LAYAEGKLAGYGELRDGDSPFIYLADPSNMDLGFQLLTIMEEKALRQKVENLELFTRISEKNQTLLKLFASYGYKTNLSFLIMELGLDRNPGAPEWPQGIRVRCFVPGQDEQATYLADEEASEDKGYHQPLDFDAWAKRMRLKNEQFDPSLWFLAHAGNELAAVALNLYHPESNTGWIDHLSVRRPWRKKGIGRALLLHSFAEFYRRGFRRAKLSVDSRSLTNAPRLYESLGMKTVQQYHIYTKSLVRRDPGLAFGERC